MLARPDTRPATLRMPRVNANEDGATIVFARVAPGERFEAGALLFELETTKATVEVEAPFAGTATGIAVEPGRDYEVGTVLLTADVEAIETDAPDWDFSNLNDAEESGTAQVSQVSLKARMRAKELGVDVDAITATGRVTVADVEAHAAAVPAAPRSGAMPDRFEPSHVLMVGEGGHALTVEDAAAGSGLTVAHRMSLRPDADGSAAIREMMERGLRQALIGVGGATSNEARGALFDFLKESGLALPPLVARGAHLSPGSTLGEATYLFAGATVGPAVRIGDDCIVNHGAVVCHDSLIGHHVHLTPSATVAGGCRIGDHATIGMNASIMNGVSVGERCLVHNNAAVARDIAAGTTVTT